MPNGGHTADESMWQAITELRDRQAAQVTSTTRDVAVMQNELRNIGTQLADIAANAIADKREILEAVTVAEGRQETRFNRLRAGLITALGLGLPIIAALGSALLAR